MQKRVKNITNMLTKDLIRIDPEKCILCGMCARACDESTGTKAMRITHSFDSVEQIQKHVNLTLDESKCVYCGQCAKVCPVGAISLNSDLDHVKEWIKDPKLQTVVAMAPALRVSIGDALGVELGTNLEGNLYGALRELGFDHIFDLNYTADTTITEEGTELIDRLQNGGRFPMMTSCCPSWVMTTMKHRPEFVDNLSTAKSPQQMFGALAKTYFPDTKGIDPKIIRTVTIVPCSAKRIEKLPAEQQTNGMQEIDAALTTRELIAWLEEMKMDLLKTKEAKADTFMAAYSGGGAIFGQSGGVMESALRYAYQVIEKKPLEMILEPLRGMEAVKTAELELAGTKYKVAVINGSVHVDKFVKEYMQKDNYLFVEVMACAGGCIGGGGQPTNKSMKIGNETDAKLKRIKALQDIDKDCVVKEAAQNPMVKDLYDNYLDGHGSDKAHKLLHVNNFNIYEEINKKQKIDGTFKERSDASKKGH